MLRYLAKGVATGMARTFGGAVVALSLIPLIVRNVGESVYGIWALVFIFIGLSSALDIGIPKALVYLIPKEEDKVEADSVFCASAFIVLALMALVVAVCAALIYSQVPVWGHKAEIPAPLSNLLLVSGAAIVCCGLISSLCQALLEAHFKIHFVNTIFLLRTASLYAGVFFVSVRSTQIEHLIYATMYIYIFFVLVDVLSIKVLTGVGFARPGRRHCKAVINRGKDFFVIGLVTSINRPLTRYLVALLAIDMAANFMYDVSFKIAMMASAALSAFSVPLFAIFSRYGKKDIQKIKRVLSRMTFLLAGLFAVGSSLYYFIGPAILEFAFEQRDARLLNTSLILLIGRAFGSIFEPYTRALWALGHTKICIAIRFLVLFMTVFLFFALSFMKEPLYRIALSFVLPLAVEGVLWFVIFYRLYGFGANSGRVLEGAANV